MTGKNQHVVPHQDGWAVKGAGNQRATSVHNTQQQAIDAGRDIARNQQSGSFNTTGEVWFVITENPNGWQASEVQGRRIYVNGTQVTAGQMPLPAAINGRRYFRFTAGDRSWASWSFW